MSRKEKIAEEEFEKRKNKRKLPLVLVIFIIFVLIIALLCGEAYYWYTNAIGPVSNSDTVSIEVDIEPGVGISKIASILKENGVINDEFAFKIYCKLNNITNLQAGEYELNKSMTVEEITKILQGGEIIDKSVIITFNEGKNMRGIATIISENTINEYNDVMEIFESKTYAESLIEEYWFLTDEILDDDIYYPLEGYLFPDTYTFESDQVTVDEIVKKMLNQTDTVLSEYKLEIQNKGYTVHTFLTLASVVENEGISTTDRSGIAAVFLNRIEKNMALQSDVTTYYAFKIEIGSRDLTQEELDTYNKYNTRGPSMEGVIPVGPISNVSKSAIEATLNPDNTDALFFVADKNGKVYFSSTNEEHEKTIQSLKDQGLWYTY